MWNEQEARPRAPLILRVPNTRTPRGLTGDCPQQVRPVLSHTAQSVYRSRVLLPPEPPGCRQPQLSSDSAPSLGLGPRGTPWTCCSDRGQQAKTWRATYLVPTRPLHSRLRCSRPSPPTWAVPFPHLTCLVRQVRVLSGRDPWGENSLPLSLLELEPQEAPRTVGCGRRQGQLVHDTLSFAGSAPQVHLQTQQLLTRLFSR